MDNRTREQVIANEDRLIEEIDKQAKVIQWYEKENRHNQEIIIKDTKEIERLNNIFKEVRETLINSKEYKMAKELDLTSKMSILIKLLEILDKAGVDKEC